MIGSHAPAGVLSNAARVRDCQEKRRARGVRQVTVWLEPEDIDRLARLKVRWGSASMAIRLALLAADDGAVGEAAPGEAAK